MLSKPVLFLVGFVSVLGLSSIPQRALAAWGDEAWGTMLWGLPVAVPTLPGAGLIVLALAFSASAAWTLRKRRPGLGLPVLLVLLAVPVVVVASTITLPHEFQNGTLADANEMNDNFGAVKAAVDDNDNRIITLETTPGQKGDTGSQGPAGADSTVEGPAGADGAAGAQGLTGADGAQGLAGATGAAGIDGAQGVAGPSGVTLVTSVEVVDDSLNAVDIADFKIDAASISFAGNLTDGGNTAVGEKTLESNTTGRGNTASGSFALSTNTGATDNTANGAFALRNTTVGSRNTASGRSALQNLTLGNNNIALGYEAGLSTTGSNNIMIGNEGVAGEGSTIRIGTTGTHTTTHLAGAVQVNGNSVINTAGEWVGSTAGLQGADGADGATGAQGLAGADGATGAQGDQGFQGLIGLTGAAGAQGLAGADGTNGAQGVQGEAGPTGPLGPHVRPGSQNTAVGGNALLDNTTGGGNTATGTFALFSNINGSLNTASGNSALRANISGGNNTASGAGALRANITGGSNTASGASALSLNTTGGNNTASGAEALKNNTSGSFNTASGNRALISNTTGSSNTAIGREALRRNTIGGGNTALGRGALFDNTSGGENAALGGSALIKNTTGIRNTAVGLGGLRDNTIGGNNIALGYLAGSVITCPTVDPANPTSNEIAGCSRNIMIGNVGVAGDSKTIRIGNPGGTFAHTATHLAGNITVNGNSVINTAGEWVGALPVNAGPPGADSTVPGPSGPPGTNGTNGTNGNDGTDGTNGNDGADGASVQTAEIANLQNQLDLLLSYTASLCGDNTTQPGIETCDDGNTTDELNGCSATCQLNDSCGNGIVGTENPTPETCDDTNSAVGDGCNASCQVEEGWECSLINGGPDSCSSVCGDGFVRDVEECDDGTTDGEGNATDEGNGCSATCQFNFTCGNGTFESSGETCDDGNTDPNDGCSTSCTIEQGFICSPNGSGGSQCVLSTARFQACVDSATIEDNDTGLLWEVKTTSDDLHGVARRFSWSITPPYTDADGTAYTVFLAGLNGSPSFAGHTDWRLPSISELQSIFVGSAVNSSTSNVIPPAVPPMGSNLTNQSATCGDSQFLGCQDRNFEAAGAGSIINGQFTPQYWSESSAASFLLNQECDACRAWTIESTATRNSFIRNPPPHKVGLGHVRAVRTGSCTQ